MEQSRPLSMQALDNLRALSRLRGYIRFFDPSDAAAAADWEQIAINFVQTVENAQNARELASVEAFRREAVPRFGR
jgi:hypothetical protein